MGKCSKSRGCRSTFRASTGTKRIRTSREAALTEVEKKNIATIAAYEKRAVTAMSTIEG